VGAIFNAGLLYAGLRRKNILPRRRGGTLLIVKIVLASAVMGAFLVWFGGTLAQWLNASTAERALHLAGLVVGGGTLYFALLWLMGVRVQQLLMRSSLNGG
jgi:putative peptidoglycan lipid II flippase